MRTLNENEKNSVTGGWWIIPVAFALATYGDDVVDGVVDGIKEGLSNDDDG